VKSRLHHTIKPDGSDDLFFALKSGHFRQYDAATDPTPIRPGLPASDASDTSDPIEHANRASVQDGSGSEFAYEHDLRDYLARNLELVEPGLRLYSDEGITGVEFPAGGRYIDILAVDRDGAYVVIELKVSKGYDRVVGQLLRYIGWIEKHHADPSQAVRGIIIAKDISDDLRLACSRIAGVALYEYSLSVSLRQVTL
jgi:hypothetical protein